MPKFDTLANKYRNLITGIITDATTVAFQINKGGNTWAPIGDLNFEKPEDNWKLGRYRILINGDEAAEWELYQMPHCCGICVSCRAYVHLNFRKKGLGTLLNNLRQEIARLLGYSLLLCTDVEQNEPQRKVLKLNGWKDIHKFVNSRTQNTIFISAINL